MFSKAQQQPALAGYLNLTKSMRNLMAQFAYLTRMYSAAVYSGYGDAQGNQDAANYYTQLLYLNANDLAAQYAKMNPFWEEMQWRTLLYNYINLIVQDAVTLGSRDFEKELDIFERMLLASLAIGDYLGDGLYQYMIGIKKEDGKSTGASVSF